MQNDNLIKMELTPEVEKFIKSTGDVFPLSDDSIWYYGSYAIMQFAGEYTMPNDLSALLFVQGWWKEKENHWIKEKPREGFALLNEKLEIFIERDVFTIIANEFTTSRLTKKVIFESKKTPTPGQFLAIQELLNL